MVVTKLSASESQQGERTMSISFIDDSSSLSRKEPNPNPPAGVKKPTPPPAPPKARKIGGKR